MAQLLDHPRIDPDSVPDQRGQPPGIRTSRAELNQQQLGDPANDTADFDDAVTGNLRLDYLCPTRI